jgi:acetyl-CoA synthetase
MSEATIQSVSRESRKFASPPEFSRKASIPSRERYDELYRRSIADPEGFWREQAQLLHWFREPQHVLTGTLPHPKWFEDGTLNVSFNCLDRHVAGARRHKTAIVWEGEPGEQRTITYQELLRETCRLANVLESLGIKKGDRVAIYMGMVPEAAIAMLACTRIGAVHASTTPRQSSSSRKTAPFGAVRSCRSKTTWTARSSSARRSRTPSCSHAHTTPSSCRKGAISTGTER